MKELNNIGGIKNFTKLYSLSKTLRFKLIPVYGTKENIKKNLILENDNQLANDYQDMKKIIDQHYKKFIDETLENSEINWKNLYDKYLEFLSDSINVKEYDKAMQAKCSELSAVFLKDKQMLFEKKLINEILNKVEDEKDRKIISNFDGFFTYLKNYISIREYIFQKDNTSGTIAYRIVSDNFPKFISNMKSYEYAKTICGDELLDLENNLSKYFEEDIKFDEIFSIDNFNAVLSQKGIEKYNQIIGGIALEGGKKIQGYNEIINLYAQKHHLDNKNMKSKSKMVPLFNQILSEHNTFSFIFDKITSDQDAFNLIKNTIDNFNVNNSFIEVISNIDQYYLSKIYIDYKFVKVISNYLFEDWGAIISKQKELIASNENLNNKERKALLAKKYTEINLEELEDIICKIDPNKSINLYLGQYIKLLKEGNNLYKKINFETKLKDDDKNIEAVKDCLDTYQKIYNLYKIFNCHEDVDEDKDFYGLYYKAKEIHDAVNETYNRIRNYVTSKPFSENKIKINFNHYQLAEGWDENKEKDNLSIILIKDDEYYLGIFNIKNKSFKEMSSEILTPAKTDKIYKKIRYKSFNPIKGIPKCVFTKDVKEHFEKSKDSYVFKASDNKGLFIRDFVISYDDYLTNFTSDHQKLETKKYQKAYLKDTNDVKGYQKAFERWADLCIRFLKSYKSTANYNFSTLKKNGDYEDLSEFYNDLSAVCYSLEYVDIDQDTVHKLVEEDKLFLFKIYNKDFAENAKGKNNLHTMYFKGVFDEYNFLSKTFKLNGGAEIFYRPASINKNITHKKGSILVGRVTKDGETIESQSYLEICKYENGLINELSDESKKYTGRYKTNIAKLDLTKNKRYTEDQFQLHLPITINYKSRNITKALNDYVKNSIKGNNNINIMGIDRGERNLIYVSIIDCHGNILKQKSYNIIEREIFDNKIQKVNYLQKLDLKEKERDRSRKSWSTIGTIKELKDGYLSAVIYEICKDIIDYNCIVAMEDLNFGFKRGRIKFEKQVYQKFEKALIDKLNYLVYKNKDKAESGSIFNGYQLAEKFENFKKMTKQNGIIFYVPAKYTSKIDPTTGFVNIIDTKELKKSDENGIKCFDSITYDKQEDAFVYKINLKKFKCFEAPVINSWDIYTKGERIVYQKKVTFSLNLTTELKNILYKYNISINEETEYKEIILSIKDEKAKKDLIKEFLYIFTYALVMRNSNAKIGEDYILSPVKNDTGTFFKTDNNINGELPADADANGAYHIAMKGLILKRKIDEDQETKIKNSEYLEFMQLKKWKNF